MLWTRLLSSCTAARSPACRPPSMLVRLDAETYMPICRIRLGQACCMPSFMETTGVVCRLQWVGRAVTAAGRRYGGGLTVAPAEKRTDR